VIAATAVIAATSWAAITLDIPDWARWTLAGIAIGVAACLILAVLIGPAARRLAGERHPLTEAELRQMTVNEQQGILEIDTVLGRLERLTSIVERELERMRSRNNEERETLVQQSLFERRPELLQLPAVQEAYTSGRIEGMRKIIIQIAAERFRVDQAYPPLLEHIHHFHEEAELEQLALRVISAANFDEFMAAIG